MVQLCHFTHQQTKGGIFELPGIIFFAAQLAGEDVFQLNVIALRERDVLGQLVDGQCIVAVLHDVAVDPLPVLPEVITGVQRLALSLFQHRVGKGGVDWLLPFHTVHQKLDQLPQLLPHFLKAEQIVGGQEFVRLYFPDERQLGLHLRDGGFLFQQSSGVFQLPLRPRQPGQTFQLTEQQPIHKIIEPLGRFVLVVQRDKRCDLPH